MNLLRQLLCTLFGHSDDTRIHWGAWMDDPEMGRHRVVTEECERCRGVVALASVVEGERWR